MEEGFIEPINVPKDPLTSAYLQQAGLEISDQRWWQLGGIRDNATPVNLQTFEWLRRLC
jgi:hypothetical protein